MSHAKASVLVSLVIAATAALTASAALTACTPPEVPPQPLAAEVQLGPAAETRPARVLVLQARCGSVQSRCPPQYGEAVDAIVRSRLEFAGYTLVESEGLLNQTRQRREEQTTETNTAASASRTEKQRPLGLDTTVTTASQSTSSTETTKITLDGSTFEDLSVTERHEVLEKSGADSVLSVRIVVGGQTEVWIPNQNVEVMVKLGVKMGDSMAWASRCTARSDEFTTVTAALENAARCAIQGALGR